MLNWFKIDKESLHNRLQYIGMHCLMNVNEDGRVDGCTILNGSKSAWSALSTHLLLHISD